MALGAAQKASFNALFEVADDELGHSNPPVDITIS
jgi:hypothetical protein